MKLYKVIAGLLFISLFFWGCSKENPDSAADKKNTKVVDNPSPVAAKSSSPSVSNQPSMAKPLASPSTVPTPTPVKTPSPVKGRVAVNANVNPLFLSWLFTANPPNDTIIGPLVSSSSMTKAEEKAVEFINSIIKKKIPQESDESVRYVLSRFFSFISSKNIKLVKYRLGKAVFDDAGNSHLNFKLYFDDSFSTGEIVLSLDKEKWVLSDFMVDTGSFLEKTEEKPFVVGDYAMIPLY